MSDDFQSLASRQGRSFEDTVETTLKVLGWDITGRHIKVAGVEIDITATDPDNCEWWIECKGSWRGDVPGSRRSDTVKKAVGVAWYLSRLPERKPYMLATSHLPRQGTLSWLMLDAARRDALFSGIFTVGFLSSFEDDEVDDDSE